MLEGVLPLDRELATRPQHVLVLVAALAAAVVAQGGYYEGYSKQMLIVA